MHPYTYLSEQYVTESATVVFNNSTFDFFNRCDFTPNNLEDIGTTDMYEILQEVARYGIGCLIILALLTIIVSCERIRYYIRFSFFVIFLSVPPIVSIPFMLLRIRDWRNALPTVWCLKKCTKMLGVTFHIRGKEHLVKNSGSIVLINHQSVFDLCVLGELWPILERCSVIAKKEILYYGLFGLATWLWGTIFINRQKGEEAQKCVNSAAKYAKDLKMNVLMFPEGHRRSGFELFPFKKGAFHLAIASQMPIQPIVVSKYYFLNTKLMKFDSGVSYITILPSISTESLTKEDIPLLIKKSYETMNATFLETSENALKEHMILLKSE